MVLLVIVGHFRSAKKKCANSLLSEEVIVLKQPHSLRLIQQQEDQTNTKDNTPPIEEATERKPYGLRIF
jgi:hypothetical protein